MAKNDNMLAILWMLNSGKKITAQQIADKLEMNIRTVYRYIDSLCVSGVPIISDTGQNGGYRLMNDFIQSPLVFEMEEQKALLHAAEFAKGAGYPFDDALNRATKKLRSYSNEEQESTLNRHLIGFEVESHEVLPEVKAVLVSLEHAVANEYAVELLYRSKDDETSSTRAFDPYGLTYWNNRWYTVGYCHLREEIRSFRVDRIVQIKQMEKTFVRPSDFSAHDFFMQSLFHTPSKETSLIDLVIKGKAEALDDLCTHWLFKAHLKERTSSQAVFSMEDEALHTYVPYFILPYVKSLHVVEPQSCRMKLLSIATELMEYYQE